MIRLKMDFTIKLDCKPGNISALFQHQGALVAATEIYKAYMISREILIGTGPELYAEQWIHNYMSMSPRGFKDLMLIYFTKILLQGVQNAK